MVTIDPGGESRHQIVSSNQAVAIDPGGACEKVGSVESGTKSGDKVATVEIEDKDNVVTVNSEISDKVDKCASRDKSSDKVVTVDPSAKTTEDIGINIGLEKVVPAKSASELSCQVGASESIGNKSHGVGTSDKKSDEPVASVDLSTAIALINR